MKLTRNVVIGFRNIGSAAAKVEIFSGTLVDGIKWLIPVLQEHTIAKRFQISIGRNESDMMQSFESTARTGKSADALSGAMALLDSMLGDAAADDDDDLDDDSCAALASGGARIPDELDTYEA